jgi:hypothetical protein
MGEEKFIQTPSPIALVNESNIFPLSSSSTLPVQDALYPHASIQGSTMQQQPRYSPPAPRSYYMPEPSIYGSSRF